MESMDAFWIMNHLDRTRQPALSSFDEAIAFITTPVFKQFLGIEGWDETGYVADGRGIPVRDAQHSTDGFWTVDVEIEFFRILGLVRWGPGLFIRLEIRPGRLAHGVCQVHNGIKAGQKIAFKGPVLLDHDASFLEVHPTNQWFLP
jgi:hypothetical protein